MRNIYNPNTLVADAPSISPFSQRRPEKKVISAAMRNEEQPLRDVNEGDGMDGLRTGANGWGWEWELEATDRNSEPGT